MKSLKLLKSISYNAFQSVLCSTQCLCVDCDTGFVYFATKNQLVCLDQENNDIISEVPFDEFVAENDCIISMQHLPDEMALCLALDGGDILSYHIGSKTLECVGSVSCGILAMSWSPDYELVVVITGEHQLNIMNREFDSVTETNLHPDDFGEAKFVNVGWGKKETQFHGSEGKQSARNKVDDVTAATELDDGHVRVSWRGDGQYFAVGCIHRSKGYRVITTWTREGVHHSTSEIVNGLGHALDWKPSGGLIASTQNLPNKHVVRFFERNGLIHGDFAIEDGVRVRELKWNSDSSVLCLWYEVKEESVIQLWTVSNYHWYLKQNIVQKVGIGGFLWDPEHVYRMHIWLEDGRYLKYEWAWTTFTSHAYHTNDLSTVAVIDGSEVLMTSFKMAIVPPPMSSYKLKLPSPAHDVTFSPTANQIIVLTNNHELIIHDVINVRDGRNVTEERQYKIELPFEYGVDITLHHLTLLYDGNCLLVSQTPDRKSFLHLFKPAECTAIKIDESVSVDGNILAVRSTISDVALQMENGRILRLNLPTATVSPWLDSGGKEFSFPQPCNRMEICSFNDETVVLGLTDRYRFYVNSLEVASNCTSFSVHRKFVLLTTHAHTIRCIPRTTRVADLVKLADDKGHPFDECVRRIERGSQIVLPVSDGTSVVLQMPRGNLETIHPRALVLSSVRDNLDSSQYDLAFGLMKKHRINMNLIHDHNPEKFLYETEKFVRQIGKSESLNIFLTELQDADVTVTMYDSAYKELRAKSKVNCNKVDVICDKMRQTLEAIDHEKFFLSILTCFVKKRKPDLESALFEIRKLKEQKTGISLDESMKYLLYLVDVNQLFDIALGTYDFELVLMVAEKSQKDPKEYIPMLNQLRNMEENYRKFTIDKMLKRYSGALKNIVKCPEKFDECLKLIVEFSLYTEALTLFERGCDKYRQIACAQGMFMEEKKYYEEAGLAFWKAEEWEMAIAVFTTVLCWHECLCIAEQAKFTLSRKQELARDLSVKLKAAGRNQEAAEILEKYLEDYEEAIAALVDGEHWSEALSLIYRHNRLDFVETNLKPKIAESLDHHSEQLPEIRAQFENYYGRLCDVRSEKERWHRELISDPNYNDADVDLYSDVSSASGDTYLSKRTQSSFFSTASRTNRARRKADRKKFSLKHGSPNEDLALVDALSKLIKRVEHLKTEIGPLLRVLVLYDKTPEAQKLQDAMVEFLQLIKDKIPEIWLEEDVDEEFGTDSNSQAISLAALQQRQMLKTELNKEPALRCPPVMKSSLEWKLRTLKSDR